MFFLKEIFVNMTENKICNILASFLDQFEKLMSYQAINVILHYLIIPILLYYEKMKMKNELIETYLIREISNKLINEDFYKNFNIYDEATNLEVIKLIIVINTYFWHCFSDKEVDEGKDNKDIKENKEKSGLNLSLNSSVVAVGKKESELNEYINKTFKYLYLKYNSTSAALVLYGLLGIVTNSNLRSKLTPDRFVNYYIRSSHIDQLNIGNLSYDIFINYSLNKPISQTILNSNIIGEEPQNSVLKYMKNMISDRSVNSSQLSNAFSMFLKYSNLFKYHATHISGLIIAFITKLLNFTSNSSNILIKKLLMQLIGLMIYWLKQDIIERVEDKQSKEKKDNILMILLRYFKIFFFQSNSNDYKYPRYFDHDNDYIEFCRKYFIYAKELFTISNFPIKKIIQIFSDGEIFQTNYKLYIIQYFFLIKIAICYFQKDEVNYTNIT